MTNAYARALVHEVQGIKHALWDIVDVMLMQQTHGGEMTEAQKAALAAKAAAIKAKVDASTAAIGAQAAELDDIK